MYALLTSCFVPTGDQLIFHLNFFQVNIMILNKMQKKKNLTYGTQVSLLELTGPQPPTKGLEGLGSSLLTQARTKLPTHLAILGLLTQVTELHKTPLNF